MMESVNRRWFYVIVLGHRNVPIVIFYLHSACRSGDSRGFGFLSLERDEDADAAIRALDQTEWNSRIILVEKSKTSVR